jgi:hypothetical protein
MNPAADDINLVILSKSSVNGQSQSVHSHTEKYRTGRTATARNPGKTITMT